MRSKNIFAPLLCYFILTAFVGCMTCEFLFHSEMSSKKVQQLSTKTFANFDLSFLFEEDEDSNDNNEFDLLQHPSYVNRTLPAFQFHVAFNKNSIVNEIILQSKTPLFIQQRTLRI